MLGRIVWGLKMGKFCQKTTELRPWIMFKIAFCSIYFEKKWMDFDQKLYFGIQ